MTIPTQQASQTFLGNGVTNTFDFSFVGDSSIYILVQYTNIGGTVVTLAPSQYSVFLNPPETGQIWGIGGTVTYPTVGSPIAIGTFLSITRILPLTQVTSISNQGAFFPQVIEAALDTLEMQLQQVSGRTGLFRGVWSTNVLYNFGDYVVDGANGTNTGNYYMCVIANTSGTWSTDLANGDWILVINVQAITADVAAAAASAAAAANSASSASTSATNAATSATAAATSATNASNSASAAAISATQAGDYATSYSGTSSSSITIGLGTKTFTTQSGKLWVNGQFLQIASNADATNYMHGTVSSYGGTTLTMNITDLGGSGTFSDWNIGISGAQGPAGSTASFAAITSGTNIIAAMTVGTGASISTSGTGTNVATTLNTPRAIYGNNFDGSTALNEVIASTFGGTGNGFTKFSGPTTSEKTFTLPNASSTVLTTNNTITVAQGGTGQTSYTDGQLLIGNTSGNTLAKNTLTQGAGITITNGNGTITIASNVFTAKFTSTQQTLTAGGSLTLAHGLGAKPFCVGAYLVCQSAEGNYSIGDELFVTMDQTSGTIGRGASCVRDATNLIIRFGSNAILYTIMNKTTGAEFDITTASWKIVFFAWV